MKKLLSILLVLFLALGLVACGETPEEGGKENGGNQGGNQGGNTNRTILK